MMGIKVGVKKPGEHRDAQVNEFMDASVAHAQFIEGDPVEFDHPSGIDGGLPFTVKHELGVIPGSMAVEDNGTSGGAVFATAEDREKWTKDTITLRSADRFNRRMCVRVRRKTNA